MIFPITFARSEELPAVRQDVSTHMLDEMAHLEDHAAAATLRTASNAP
jgi:hypothetical protein